MQHRDASVISEISLTAQFEMSHPSDSVDVDIWYTSNDDRSLVFVKDMSEFIMPLAGSREGINVHPKFVHWAALIVTQTLKRKIAYLMENIVRWAMMRQIRLLENRMAKILCLRTSGWSASINKINWEGFSDTSLMFMSFAMTGSHSNAMKKQWNHSWTLL